MNAAPYDDVLATLAQAVAVVEHAVSAARIRRVLRLDVTAGLSRCAAHDRVLGSRRMPGVEAATIPGPHLLL